MTFTDELWQSIETIYASILRHPFLRGLTDGSLPRESFRFYAVQDALYLRAFARALSIAAARAPEDDWIIMFTEHAAGALRVERALHESFFQEFGLRPEDVAGTPLAWPTGLPSTKRSRRCCPVTGSTGRWARRWNVRAHRTRSTRAGSGRTPPRSSVV